MAGFESISLQALGEASTPIQVYPEWGFSERIIQQQKSERTLGGGLHTYKLVGEAYAYTMPLDFVSSSTMSTINLWWRTQRDVMLTINSGSAPLSLVCRITNKNVPISARAEVKSDSFKGTIFLQSVKSTVANPSPFYSFTLDDPYLGKLDQTYNLLSPNATTTRAERLGKTSGVPFTLDESVNGMLDQTYNFLY